MHAFNSKCVIHKERERRGYILREFCGVRLALYRDRLAYTLNELKEKLPYHENVVRFIRHAVRGHAASRRLRKKAADECDRLLASG
jgi:hypothetical protein